MRFAALGSGSRGNALVVEAGSTRVLLDCGFGPREIGRRLGRLGLVPQDIAAIVVTHEHSDHVGGVARCASSFGWTICASHGTRAAAFSEFDGLTIELIRGDVAFSVGDLHIQPFPVPHDAREPVQYAFSDGQFRLGVLTDVGEPTVHISRTLSGCDALVLECNHDEQMLMNGAYPPMLKRRIAGRLGHLANHVAAELLAGLDRSRLQHVIAAHLSEHNNRPDMARAALAGALGCEPDWIGVASQDEGFAWRTLG